MKLTSRVGDFDLFIIVTPDFLPGALVTLSSFAKHHPDIRPRVTVLQRDLQEVHRDWLRRLPLEFRFRDHDPELARLASKLPIFPERRNRLLVLQAFSEPGDRPLLVVDADLLFQGPVLELFEGGGEILGSGESLHLRGGWRDGTTLAPGEGAPPEGALTRTINTGVFRVSTSLRGEGIYRELLGRLEPEWWDGLHTDLTDQALLNHHFKDLIEVAPPGFNYVLQYQEIFQKASGLRPEECPVLHFAGPIKPWNPHTLLERSLDVIKAGQRWTQEWLRVLTLLA